MYHLCPNLIKRVFSWSLIATYTVALLISVLLYPILAKQETLTANFKSLNWASFSLGAVIVRTAQSPSLESPQTSFYT